MWIATDKNGSVWAYGLRPERKSDSWAPSAGDKNTIDLTLFFNPALNPALNIPVPSWDDEPIEWPPPAQTASSKPEYETLVPITSLDQLKVGDRVENNSIKTRVMATIGEIVAIGTWNEPQWLNLRLLKVLGYQQVITTPRTLSRDEARKAMDEGKTVKSVGGRITYKLSGDKMRIEATEGSSPVSIAVHVEMFGIPEGRYEIVGGE